MKKTINGRTYNTETAKVIDIYGNESPERSPDHFSEVLYCTTSGDYFLHRKGAADNEHPIHRIGESIPGGETIIPLSEDLAMEWTELSCDSDVYTRVFEYEII